MKYDDDNPYINTKNKNAPVNGAFEQSVKKKYDDDNPYVQETVAPNVDIQSFIKQTMPNLPNSGYETVRQAEIDKYKEPDSLISVGIGKLFGKEAGQTSQAVENAIFNPLGLQDLALKGLSKIDSGFAPQYEARKQLAEENPVSNMTGKLTGDLVTGAPIFKGIGAGVSKALPYLDEAGTIASQGVKMALEGAGFGALEGGISGVEQGKGFEGTAREMAQRAKDYAVFGGLLGGGVGAVGKGIGAIKNVGNDVDEIFGGIRGNIESYNPTAMPRQIPTQLEEGKYAYKPQMETVPFEEVARRMARPKPVPENPILGLPAPVYDMPPVRPDMSNTRSLATPKPTSNLQGHESRIDNWYKNGDMSKDDLLALRNELNNENGKLFSEQMNFLTSKNSMGNKPTQGNLVRDSEGTVINRKGRTSNNELWYQDWAKENRVWDDTAKKWRYRQPTQDELKELAEKQLISEGARTVHGNMPINESYLYNKEMIKDIDSYISKIEKGEIKNLPDSINIIRKNSNNKELLSQYKQQMLEYRTKSKDIAYQNKTGQVPVKDFSRETPLKATPAELSGEAKAMYEANRPYKLPKLESDNVNIIRKTPSTMEVSKGSLRERLGLQDKNIGPNFEGTAKVKSSRELPDISKMNKQEFDSHYGLDQKYSNKNITRLVEDTGAKVINKVSSNDIPTIIKHYQKKYNLPDVKVTYRPNQSGKLGNTERINFDANGNSKGYKININPNQSIEGKVGTLRHEIEHIIDLQSEFKPSKQPLLTNKDKQAMVNKSMREGYATRQSGHHKNYEWFEADYLRRASVKDALKEGREVPQSVLDEFPDLKDIKPVEKVKTMENVTPISKQQATDEVFNPVNNQEGQIIPSNEYKGFKTQAIEGENVNMDTKTELPTQMTETKTKQTEIPTLETEPVNYKTSKFYDNTVQKGNYIDDAGKKEIIENDFKYEPISETETTSQAIERINKNGFDKTKENIIKKESFDNVDAEESMIIARELVKEAEKTGNYSNVNAWLSNIREKYTKMGKGIQALAKWSRTPSGYLKMANEMLEKSVSNAKLEEFKNLKNQVREIFNLEILDDTLTSTAKQAKIKTVEEKLNKLFPERKLGIKRSTPTDKLIEMYEQGIFDDGKIYNTIAEKMGIPHLSDDLAQSIIESAKKLQSMEMKGFYNLREAEKITTKMITDIANTIPATFGRRINTLQTVQQLLNTLTPLRNIVGNEANYRMLRTSKLLDNVIDYGISKYTGAERTISLKKGTNIWDELDKIYGDNGRFFSKLKEGAKEAWKGYQTYGGHDFKYGMNSATFKSKLNPLTYMEKATGVSLRSFDLASYERGLRNRVFEMADVSAINKGLKGAEREVFIKDYINNLTEDAYKTATEYGRKLTFQGDTMIGTSATLLKDALNVIGIGRVTRQFGEVGGKAIGAREFGLGNILGLKYARTGGNILSSMLDFTPMGYVNFATQWAKGNKREAIEALTQATVGTGATMIAYKLGKLGLITPPADKDIDVRELSAETGLGSSKLNIDGLTRYIMGGFKEEDALRREGDKFENFEWALPVSASVLVGSNFASSKTKVAGIASSLFEAFDSSTSTLTDLSLIRSLKQSMESYGNGEAFWTNLVSNTVTGFTGSWLKQIRNLTDNIQRETKNPDNMVKIINSIKNRIPLASRSLPPKISTTGQVKELYKGGANNPLNILFNPGFLSEYKSSEGIETILKLYEETGNKTQFPRKITDTTIEIGKETVPLTDKQKEFLQIAIGQETMTKLDKLSKNPRFVKLGETPEGKEKQVEQIVYEMGLIAKNTKNVLKKLISEEENIRITKTREREKKTMVGTRSNNRVSYSKAKEVYNKMVK